jgi:pumilio family protein 6
MIVIVWDSSIVINPLLIIIENRWIFLNRHDIPEEERRTLCLQLHRLVDGNADKLIFAHDTTRVIQTLWRYGGEETRAKLFAELSPRLLELAASKYAKFYVRKVILYGSKTQKSSVLERLLEDAPRLLAHIEASDILELAYRECHSSLLQRRFVHQFYGPAFQLFASNSASASLKQAVSRGELPTDQLRPALEFMEGRLHALTNKCAFTSTY